MISPFVIFFLNLGGGEITLVILIIVMFFGTDKLPEMARAFGKGMKEMKNATAEIQREIEKGAADIQKDTNIGDEIADIKKAADKMTSQLQDGINSIEEHHNPKTEIEQQPDTPENNPLIPPDAIKRD